jgi:WD40 repeat protein
MSFHCFCVIDQQIDAHESPLAAMAFSSNGTYLATASGKGTIIRVFLVAQATKVNSTLFIVCSCNQLDFPKLFLHTYFNSHTVFGGEHTHQQYIHSHSDHRMICPMFLLPQVHQARCTCFSSMLPEIEGTKRANCLVQ